MEYKTTQFTVDELKIETARIGIKGGGIWHTLWKEYQDEPTDAYLIYQKLGDITGQFVEIEYYEKPNPKNEKYPFKTITKIKPGMKDTTESDIKSTEQPPGKAEPNWDRINADKQHSITIAIAMKLAVQSMPAKAKLLDYEEIEVRMVKFSTIMSKYLGVVMKEQKPKFPPLVQAKWNEFDEYLEENKEIDSYLKVRDWLDGLTDPTSKVLTEQLSKLKETLRGEYESYHESLITGCCEILKTKDRLPIIQTLDTLVKNWRIDGLKKLSETTENQCLDLAADFDKLQKDDEEQDLPF